MHRHLREASEPVALTQRPKLSAVVPTLGRETCCTPASFEFLAARTPASGLRRTGASYPAATIHAADLYAIAASDFHTGVEMSV